MRKNGVRFLCVRFVAMKQTEIIIKGQKITAPNKNILRKYYKYTCVYILANMTFNFGLFRKKKKKKELHLQV